MRQERPRSPGFDLMCGNGFAGLHGRDLWMAYVGDRLLASGDRESPGAGDHEAHAPGDRCARCGWPLSPRDPVRRRADRTWVHQTCRRA